MTATALRTSINADLQMLSVESLQAVSKYVKRKVREPRDATLTENRQSNPTKREIENKIQCINETAGVVQISEEDINNDERLAYILRNNR